jgi:predicted lipoprotein with Yx(FWY)xxD motif
MRSTWMESPSAVERARCNTAAYLAASASVMKRRFTQDMDRKIAFVAATVGAAFLTASCGGVGTSAYGSSTPPGRSPGAATPSAGASGPSTIATRTTPLGQILVDGNGRALYLFEADKGTSSSCYDACAGVWPPLTTSGTPVAGAGVTQSLLTTTTRNDGSAEVVYNGHPLYYFISDKQAGDTTGQGLSSFGADWYVLSAAGTKVDAS